MISVSFHCFFILLFFSQSFLERLAGKIIVHLILRENELLQFFISVVDFNGGSKVNPYNSTDLMGKHRIQEGSEIVNSVRGKEAITFITIY